MRYTKILTEKFLIKEYIKNKKSLNQVSIEIGCSSPTILRYLRRYKIKIRNQSESHKGLQIGKNNPNFKHGKYCKNYINYCVDCNIIIDARSKRCYQCNTNNRPAFLNRKHSQKSKKLIGLKSKKKWTKKYRDKIKTKHNGNKRTVNKYIIIKNYKHPNHNKHNDMLEHRLVYEAYLNKVSLKKWIAYGLNGNYPKNTIFLKPKDIIHHINFIRDDNRIKNLYLYINTSEHLKLSKSLNKLIKYLLIIKILEFKNGEYKIKGAMPSMAIGGKL